LASPVAPYTYLDDRPAISAITVLELYAGARSQRDEPDIVSLRQPLACLPVAKRSQSALALSCGTLGKAMRSIWPTPLIAATAEHHGLRLATLNVNTSRCSPS
jgi:predicted nucleic acid-binding protein